MLGDGGKRDEVNASFGECDLGDYSRIRGLKKDVMRKECPRPRVSAYQYRVFRLVPNLISSTKDLH